MENNCILFSPVGHTDPVKNNHDGALLHICRHYQPKKVYIFYSGEMCKIHEYDHRYEAAINDLNERCGLDIQCEAILKPELEDVHRFDLLADIIKSEIDKIHDSNENDEILLNVSSGTPAMKGALILISNLLPDSYHLKAIQVSAPGEAVREKEAVNKEDSEKILEQIKNNVDFEPNAVNRAYIESKSTIYAEIIKKDICAHIDAYDYTAALRQVKEVKEHNGRISERAEQLIEAANARLNEGDKTTLCKILTKEEYADVFPYSLADLTALGEYAMWMKVKLDSKQSADFIRGITPICYELPIKYMKNVLGKDIMSICDRQDRGDFFDEKKAGEPLYNECKKILNRKYQYDNKKPWSSEVFIKLVIGFGADFSDVDDFKKLRKYEWSVRNKVAHTVVDVKSAENFSTLSMDDVWKLLRRLLKHTFKMTEKNFKEYLKSYDVMNKIIKAEIVKHIEPLQ